MAFKMRDNPFKQKVDPDAPGTPGEPGYEPRVEHTWPGDKDYDKLPKGYKSWESK